ncbi:MAG TPA: HupE/UreJ family protein [Devosia sp.]|nr:HupE/UreJ family protein [Devosia sp.]
MTPRSIGARLVLGASMALIPTIASAHVGASETSGFAHGFLHPLSGIDHILAMVAVGMLAANLGGRALWAVPLSFVGMMAVGGALGVLGIAVPLVEIGIGLSVAVLGAAVALGWKWPVTAGVVVGFFAIFHGHAHGSEMPVDAAGLVYGTGFMLATAMLHAVGIGLGLGVARLGNRFAPRAIRASGAVMAVAGIGILTGVV